MIRISDFLKIHISFPLAIDNAADETFNAYCDVNYVLNVVLIGGDGLIISDRVADYNLLIQSGMLSLTRNLERDAILLLEIIWFSCTDICYLTVSISIRYSFVFECFTSGASG